MNPEWMTPISIIEQDGLPSAPYPPPCPRCQSESYENAIFDIDNACYLGCSDCLTETGAYDLSDEEFDMIEEYGRDRASYRRTRKMKQIRK